MRYRVDEQRVAHQELEGEVIAIDFANGVYFSMRGTAAAIWRALSTGADLRAIVDCYRHPGSALSGNVEAEIEAFAEALVTAKLLLPDDCERVDDGSPPLPANYTTPELEMFEDMADLIMLDPVHDVSEAGWPHAVVDA